MLTLCISAPEECAGKVIGEIVNAEGEFDSPVIEKGRFIVEAQVPAAKSLDLPAKLAAISGRARRNDLDTERLPGMPARICYDNAASWCRSARPLKIYSLGTQCNWYIW